MKKTIQILAVALILFTACQTKTSVKPIDYNAIKEDVAKVIDNYNSSLIAKDASAQSASFANDILILGTDPSEFWTKEDFLKLTTEMFSDSTLKFDFTVDKREIKVSEDGNSAIVIEQMITPFISKKVPIRTIFHLIRSNNTWQINFFSVALIPLNNDLSIIDKALE